MIPEFKEKLEKLLPRFVDLAKIFQNGYIYNRLMGGSFSIKSVLPALFPNDETLNYENLDVIHRGDEASYAYMKLATLSEGEYHKTRESLLAYCKLDSYAMLKIYHKIIELVSM